MPLESVACLQSSSGRSWTKWWKRLQAPALSRTQVLPSREAYSCAVQYRLDLAVDHTSRARACRKVYVIFLFNTKTKLIMHLLFVFSSRRERHAKTMEVAQEEVVTCVGICLLERLQRVAQRLREEEQMADMLQFASLQAMRRSFELAVESKRGFSQVRIVF